MWELFLHGHILSTAGDAFIVRKIGWHEYEFEQTKSWNLEDEIF